MAGRTSYHLHTIILGCIIFSQYTSICVRVVTTDDDNGFDIQFADNLKPFLKLFHLLQLCTARTYHIETACITVFIYNVLGQLHIIMVYESAGAENETIKPVFGIQLLYLIEKTCYHIMAAGSLSA